MKSILFCVSPLVIASTVVYGQLGQDYPANTSEYQDAIAAIAGGIGFSDAIEPQPYAIRDFAAEAREIWEAISASQWNDGTSEYVIYPPNDYNDVIELVGITSDGTDYSVSVDYWEFHTVDELLDAADPEDHAVLSDLNIAVAHCNGTITSTYGSVGVYGYYVEYDSSSGNNRESSFLPYWQYITDREFDGLGSQPEFITGEPQCNGCALEECIDDAHDFHGDCGLKALSLVAAGFGRQQTGNIFSALSAYYAAGRLAALCDQKLIDDIELCLDAYTTSWYECDDGYYHYSLD